VAIGCHAACDSRSERLFRALHRRLVDHPRADVHRLDFAVALLDHRDFHDCVPSRSGVRLLLGGNRRFIDHPRADVHRLDLAVALLDDGDLHDWAPWRGAPTETKSMTN